jgi:hypothetical protein
MADISVTAASVQKTSSTLWALGVAGGTITAGQPVYADATASSKLKAADADVLATSKAVGIALHGASDGQPLQYATGGTLTFNAVLAAGQVYVASTNAGGIAPVADMGSGDFVTVLGIGVSTTLLKIGIIQSAVAKT